MNKTLLISLFVLGWPLSMFATGDDQMWLDLANIQQDSDQADYEYFLTEEETNELLLQLPDLNGHAPLETVLNVPMDIRPDLCDDEEYVTDVQMLKIFTVADEDPLMSKLFVHDGSINPNDSNQPDSEQTSDQLYQEFSYELYARDCIPYQTKAPSLTELDFIANILHRFDNDALKNFSKTQQTSYRRFLQLLSDGWWHEMLKKFRVACDPFCAKEIKLQLLLYRIINYRNKKFNEIERLSALDEENQYKQLAFFEEAAAQAMQEMSKTDASMAYASLAKRLMDFVPNKKGKGRKRENIEKILRYLLYKFDNDINWNQLPVQLLIYNRFYNWRSRGHFKELQTQILKATEHERSEEDTKILDLLDKINGYSIKKQKNTTKDTHELFKEFTSAQCFGPSL